MNEPTGPSDLASSIEIESVINLVLFLSGLLISLLLLTKLALLLNKHYVGLLIRYPYIRDN